MKKNLYLYLFIFSLIINVFIYMYFSAAQKHEAGRVVTLQNKLGSVRDSIQAEAEKRKVSDYFTLENDVNAQEYFKGQDVNDIVIKVRDAIYAQNINPKGNPLTQYPALDGRPFTISKIKVLNHRWVIVDFSNGLRWGEAIIKYFIEEDGSVSFEPAETTLFNFVPY